MSESVQDQLLNQCGPRIMNVSNVGDGSLTHLNMKGLTPDTLLALKDTAYMEYFLYTQAMKAGLTGVVEHNLWDLIMGSTKRVKLQKQTTQNRSFFLPYIIFEQEDVINANAFRIESGSAHPTAGVGDIHSGAWRAVIKNSESEFASDLKDLQQYFVIGESVIVHNISAEGSSEMPVMKIVAKENVDGGNKALVTLEPNMTSTYFTGLTTDEKKVFQPEDGVVVIGANSISDYESWCHNQPQEISLRNLVFWLQTSRFAFAYDDITKKYLDYIMAGKVNQYLEMYKELPLTKQNKRAYETWRRNRLNSFFYGQKVDENQTAEGYKKLPRVVDPKSGAFLEYKTNALGYRTLLQECDRVIDYAGKKLKMNALEESLYSMKRYRQTMNGKEVEEIDCWTSRANAQRIHQVIMGYLKYRNRTDFNQEYKPQQIAVEGRKMWKYMSYYLPDAEVTLNVIVEPFFNDHKRHFTGSLQTLGNLMLFPDWRDLSLGIADTAKRTGHTPDLPTDPDLVCALKANVRHVQMESVTWTCLMKNPGNHLWIENFSDECPEYKVTRCDPTVASE